MADGPITVTVLYAAAPHAVHEEALLLPAGVTVADALRASGLAVAFPALDWAPNADGGRVGVWGRLTALDRVLADGDRVELYRPLRVDPKVARRERFATQGARTTGLFARQRDGSKAGY